MEIGPVTGLVNNAGVTESGGPVNELDAERTRRMFEVNMLGPFICEQPVLVEQRIFTLTREIMMRLEYDLATAARSARSCE